jgi:precorrin-6y C5,15-methyltransferase (decarboxylating) CbiE subunit
MAMNVGKIVIVGCGPGSPEYVSDAARRAVAWADVLVGSRRLLELFAGAAAERIIAGSDIPALLADIAQRRAAGGRVAVLVSGDPGFYSLAQPVTARFGREACEIVPGVSSVQVAFARLGLDWIDARLLSAHGRTPEIGDEELRRCDKIAILAGSAAALRWSAQAAVALRETHAAVLCENLTLDDERVAAITPEELAAAGAGALSLVLLVRRSQLS